MHFILPIQHRVTTLLLLFLISAGSLSAQLRIRGLVTDAETKKPLPFVSVGIDQSSSGTLSDIDGKFELELPSQGLLRFSYIGYNPVSISASAIDASEPLHVRLQSKHLTLDEVTVTPKENPANRLIRLVLANRDQNNPEKMQSFSYTSYNKLWLTTTKAEQYDTLLLRDSSKADEMEVFLQKQHILFSESVSKRLFMHPDRNNETVLASRFSGLKKTPFALLATQIQSFAFYNDLISVMGKNYLNPISPGSTTRYYFQIEDTSYTAQNDTVFFISFRPFKGKNFHGLKGSLYINSHGYAIQNVIAEPIDEDETLSISIQQQYQYLEGKQWFPVQLNTDWIYTNVSTGGSDEKSDPDDKLKVVCRTYLSEIKLNPPASRKQFDEVELSMSDSITQRDERFWNRYRVDSISSKEKRTYHTIDSLGEKMNFDRKIKWLGALVTGRFPIGFIDIDLNRIIAANDYEGFRLGLGAHSNDKVSRWFRLGGYGAYGFTDKTFKYGGDVSFLLSKRREMRVTLAYSNDVIESGGRAFFENKQSLLSTEQIRNLYVNKMDRIINYEASMSFRTLKYLRANVYASHQQRWGSTPFGVPVGNGQRVLRDTFHFNEAGIQLKYAFKEKFMQTLNGKFPIGNAFNTEPVVYLNLGQGFGQEWFGQKGDFSYTRVDLKIEKGVQLTNFGRQTWQLQLGQVFGDVPYTLLYNNKGSFVAYTLSSPNSFETMRINEFTSSRYAALFFTHNFGKFLPKNKHLNPEIEVVHSMTIGSLEHKNSNYDFPIKTLEKGYLESGIKLNSLVASGISGIGVGVFYRYGPNALPAAKDNVAIKLTVGLKI